MQPVRGLGFPPPLPPEGDTVHGKSHRQVSLRKASYAGKLGTSRLWAPIFSDYVTGTGRALPKYILPVHSDALWLASGLDHTSRPPPAARHGVGPAPHQRDGAEETGYPVS